GLSVVPPGQVKVDAVIADALECAHKGAARGGNQSIMSERADNDSRVMAYDKVWVKHIKAALMENRFRLVQQPIASLQGEPPGMFDVLVRMIDHQGREVLRRSSWRRPGATICSRTSTAGWSARRCRSR